VYVSTQEELRALIATITGAPVLAIDTEFHREKTYRAKLCLLQLATDDVDAIVDPLTVGDLTPLAAILTDPATVKVFHAGSQDIEILIEACGVAPTPLFDTQVAAGFMGYQQQIGYGALVRSLCDVSLPKADSYTDWTRRPLSQTQLEYAIDDVLYLPGIYRRMVAELERTGRTAWLQADLDHLGDPATYLTDPREAWHKVKRISSLTRRQLAVVQAVAAWRETTAQRRDVPRKWVLTDEVLVEISRRCPRTPYELLEVRGLKERLTERSVRELLEAIAAALASDPATWPKIEKRPGGAHEVDGAVDLMSALLHMRAREQGVAAQFVASHDDLVRVAQGDREGNPLMEGWRYEMVGREFVDLMEGRVALGLDGGHLAVYPTLAAAHDVGAAQEG